MHMDLDEDVSGYTNILPKEFVVSRTFRIKKVSVFNISRYYRTVFVSFAQWFLGIYPEFYDLTISRNPDMSLRRPEGMRVCQRTSRHSCL